MPKWSKAGRAIKRKKEDIDASFVKEDSMLDRHAYAQVCVEYPS